VYELTPTNGGWIETTLYNFCEGQPHCTDASWPLSLISDGNGNFYGLALGDNGLCKNLGCGVVFKLASSGDLWTESVLYTFGGGSDGAWPMGNLVMDKDGNLYGTTEYGGNETCLHGLLPGCGTVFELSPGADGEWTKTVLHSFQGSDGDSPGAGLIMDPAGNLYGTTAGSVSFDPGLVFRLVHTANGWNEEVLYRFRGGADGSNPEAPLIFDKSYNLYGTTQYGGTGACARYSYSGCGVVFQLSRVNGRVEETVVHDFQGDLGDGIYPVAGLMFDKQGGLYGTTTEGGVGGWCNGAGCGTVFRIVKTVNDKVRETVVHSFLPLTGDGMNPSAGLVSDALGNVYGNTSSGGAFSSGIVFEISK
jgi:uncharacterized repeat protein (TIGR03803 family)